MKSRLSSNSTRSVGNRLFYPKDFFNVITNSTKKIHGRLHSTNIKVLKFSHKDIIILNYRDTQGPFWFGNRLSFFLKPLLVSQTSTYHTNYLRHPYLATDLAPYHLNPTWPRYGVIISLYPFLLRGKYPCVNLLLFRKTKLVQPASSSPARPWIKQNSG